MTYAHEQEQEYKLAFPMDTVLQGGMITLLPEGLAEMQQGQYILHARGGKLTKVPAEKSLLPLDPKFSGQQVATALAPDGTVYVKTPSIMCKSTDGGRTWTSYELGSELETENRQGSFQILSDGTFIAGTDGARNDSIPESRYLNGVVCASSDEGRTWQKISEIEWSQEEYPDYFKSGNYRFFRLEDDTLLCAIDIRAAKWQSLMYRSEDGGRTWQGPVVVCNWWAGVEGGIAQTASGKLLAVIRYQGAPEGPSKVIFLMDSEDDGRSWKNLRQLTTRHGQCFGYPAALSDGTVVVIHDHRYPEGLPGRAMTSYDEGQTWEDEVYFVYYGTKYSSYNQSVVLEGDMILTIAGTRDSTADHTGLTAIRWKPVRD